MIRIILRLIVAAPLLFFVPQVSGNGKEEKSRQVMYFPSGVHRMPKIVSSADYLAIKGEGSGVTVLEVPGGITLTGKDPRLTGFTLVGSGNKNTGLTLKNNNRVLIQDVEIQGYELGLLSTCDFGKRQWLHTYRDLYIYEGPDGSQATRNKNVRGVELRYEGKRKPGGGGWHPEGGFSNTHTFYGGRIAVPGIPLLIDGPSATAMFGTYIDMSEAPVRMTALSSGLQLFGVHLDRNRSARKQDLPVMVLENPKFNKVKIFGQHTDIFKHNLIRDGKGHPVARKHIFLSPVTY